MKEQFKTLLLFLYILQTKGYVCNKISLHNIRLSWKDAAQMCKDNNGILMVPDESKLEELRGCSQSNYTYDDVWIGKYTFLSPWLEIYGCYEWSLIQATSIRSVPNYVIKDNHPAICDNACGHPMFIGIKEDQCLCVGNDLSIISGYKTTADKCNISCSINTDIYCGGLNYITIYKNGGFSAIDENHKDKRCIAYSCEKDNTVHKALECSTYLQMKCENGQTTSIAKVWNSKLKDCIENFKEYAILSDNTTQFCSSFTWSGIFRSKADDQTDTINNYTIANDVINCYTLHNHDRKYVIKANACAEPKRFICETGLEISTPSVPVTNASYVTTNTEQSITDMVTAMQSNYTGTVADSTKNMADETGTIVGVVVAVVIIVAAVIGVLVFLKQRNILFRSTKATTSNNQDDSSYSNLRHNNEMASGENYTALNYVPDSTKNGEAYENIGKDGQVNNDGYYNVVDKKEEAIPEHQRHVHSRDERSTSDNSKNTNNYYNTTEFTTDSGHGYYNLGNC